MMEELINNKNIKERNLSYYIKSNWKNTYCKHGNWITQKEKGVYFLYDKCKLVYIGYSLNLHSRIKQHSCKSAIKVWDTAIYYRYKFANKKELLLIEKELIEFFKPSYNYQKWI
jgi:predicted GIY-YIG superfamily endonuclease